MGFPTPHELKAALWVVRMLPETGLSVEEARASYAIAPSGGLYRTDDLAAAEARLSDCGLLDRVGNRLSPSAGILQLRDLPEPEAVELLLIAMSERDPPLWLGSMGAGSELKVEIIPDRDLTTFERVISDPNRREAILIALGRKVDPDKATDQGSIGEAHVVASCQKRLCALGRPDLAERVRRVSLLSDQLGYDVVCPTIQGQCWRIEVKTTRSTGHFLRITLSRNEARVGLADGGWALVVCELAAEDVLAVVGWCNGATLAPLLPTDGARGAWETARVTLLRDELSEGLPDLHLGYAS
jgi:Domain of unknown function (DUF3883)